MDAERWNTCDDPAKLLDAMRESGLATDRKLRLFAAAVSRFLPTPSWYSETFRTALRRGTDAAERYADDLLESDHVNAIFEETIIATAFGGAPQPLIFAVVRSLFPSATDAATEIARYATPERWQSYCDLLRCIFSNTFQDAPTLVRASLTDEVLVAAKAAYAERALPEGTLLPERLQELAAALEATGCRDEVVLGHLRGPGPHVRGCHVVDAILGKV